MPSVLDWPRVCGRSMMSAQLFMSWGHLQSTSGLFDGFHVFRRHQKHIIWLVIHLWPIRQALAETLDRGHIGSWQELVLEPHPQNCWCSVILTVWVNTPCRVRCSPQLFLSRPIEELVLITDSPAYPLALNATTLSELPDRDGRSNSWREDIHS